MNILRATLITILVTAASLGALMIPLNIPVAVEQPKGATGATISLVDSLPFAKANLPSVPDRPKTTTVRTEVVETSDSTPSPAGEEPLPISDKGVASMEVRIEPEGESGPEAEPPISSPVDPLSDSASTDASIASVAASAVSLDPLPSLVDGYYEATSTDQGPSFNRTSLASRIRYPELAKRQGIEGLVMLQLFISSSGKVERIEVEEDPGYGLADAAVRAFTGLQGEPAVLGGKAVPVTLRYPVRFTLK